MGRVLSFLALPGPEEHRFRGSRTGLEQSTAALETYGDHWVDAEKREGSRDS
jgi:hypothetical protein